jgi:hypothetical protein
LVGRLQILVVVLPYRFDHLIVPDPKAAAQSQLTSFPDPRVIQPGDHSQHDG